MALSREQLVERLAEVSHADRHRDWEPLDFTIYPDSWRLELSSLKPVQRAASHTTELPPLCRIVAPDGSCWESERSTGATHVAPHPHRRFYPEDFSFLR